MSNARAGVPRRDEPRRWERALPVRGLGVDSGSSRGSLPRGHGLEARLGHPGRTSSLLCWRSPRGKGRAGRLLGEPCQASAPLHASACPQVTWGTKAVSCIHI